MSENLAHQLELLPLYLARHLQVALLALLIGMAVSLPLGMLLHRVRALQGPVLGVVSVIQTIPGLALLALMVPLLGMIGFVPALIALTLYSMLPMVQNTVAGLAGVDPGAVEAGRGMGMTNGQLLAKVELPLAAPTILAGVRTAAVWTIGIATLATPVGWTSLGNYIFAGLQTQNMVAVLVGCFAAAGLALALDLLIRLLERAARVRSTMAATLALVCLLPFIALAVYPLAGSGNARTTTRLGVDADQSSESSPYAGQPLTIGAKTFTEQYILAELLADYWTGLGGRPEVLSSLGSTVVFDALKSGKVDAYVDYSGTIWANYLKHTDMPDRKIMNAQIKTELLELGIQAVPLGFENAYALAMRREQADELGIESIADLAAHAPQLKIGSDYEFLQRPEWASVESAYGLSFAAETVLDPSLMYEALAQGQVDVIPAYTTDGRIDAFDLKVLADPEGALPPYDALLLIAPGGPPVEAFQPLRGAISNEVMRSANRAVDLDGETVRAAAEQLMEELDN